MNGASAGTPPTDAVPPRPRRTERQSHRRRRIDEASQAPDGAPPGGTRRWTERPARERLPKRTARPHGSDRAQPGQRSRWADLAPVGLGWRKEPAAREHQTARRSAEPRRMERTADHSHVNPRLPEQTPSPSAPGATNTGSAEKGARDGGPRRAQRTAPPRSGRPGNQRPEEAEPGAMQGRTKGLSTAVLSTPRNAA